MFLADLYCECNAILLRVYFTTQALFTLIYSDGLESPGRNARRRAGRLCRRRCAVGRRGPRRRVLRWAGDAEGGAPYVEADPADPSRVVGFDVEIADLIATRPGPPAAVR